VRNKRTFLGLLVALLTAVLVWWLNGDGGTSTQDQPDSTPSAQTQPSETVSLPDDEPTPTPMPSPTLTPPPEAGGEVHPDSGLPWVELDTLPPEAAETVALIDQGGPFPYPEKDGTTFSNREGVLPDQGDGYYKEYTVPTPGSDDRGARRIVTGSGGEFYWTDDHYRSFERIRR
jgi:ribonuclease T1